MVSLDSSYVCTLPEDFAERLVIFGAGGLGKRIARNVGVLGHRPLAFCDNNRTLWNTEIEGVQVLSPASAASAFPKAVFMVAIWHPSQVEGLRHRIAELTKQGCENVTCFIPLFWSFPEMFLPNMFWEVPSRLIEQSSHINAARDVLDKAGQEEFDRQLQFRLTGDVMCLREPEPGLQYFPEGLFRLSPEETFVDCGAYDGDTVRDFMQVSSGHFRRVIAFEADAQNFHKLEHSSQDTRVSVLPYAVGAKSGVLRLSSSGASSSISESGDHEVHCTALDDALADEQPTFIKMDIEGSEIDALMGAAATIRRFRPKLAICIYHRPDHLWRIPLLLKNLFPDSLLTLRSHMYDGFDTVCYCLPRS
jgi:FkbM family methyltransferase